MNPDLAAALRIVGVAVGTTLMVKPGIIDQPTLEILVGAVINLGVAIWAWWGNRPKSTEAIKIAERVAEDPTVPHILKVPTDETRG